MENNQLQAVPDQGAFATPTSFDHAQRVAKMLSASGLIPEVYRGNIANTMIALEMANRIGVSPLMVMQNLHIIKGSPSFSSPFIIASINTCGRFSKLSFVMSGEKGTMDRGCFAWAIELATNERIEGTVIDMKMANSEGWVNKPGSKWKTMPEQMLLYRAASFFGRAYCPEITMGMQSIEEAADIANTPPDYEQQVEQLTALLAEKEELLDAEQIADANRIISTQETKSFKKLFTLLNSL